MGDAFLFLLFFASMLVLFTLKTTSSGWAVAPHVLCNGGLFLLMLRHWSQGRPAMYWSHYDVIVAILFGTFIANVYYSEIREVSWRHAALYLDSFAGYFFGRMLFYHRIRSYAVAVTVMLVAAWGASSFLQSRAIQQEADLRRQSEQVVAQVPQNSKADSMLSRAAYHKTVAENLSQSAKAAFVLLLFWVVTTPFLFLKRPSTLAFLVYLGLTIGGFALMGVGQLSSVLAASPAEAVQKRHDKIESLLTAWRVIQTYPLTGGGLGTFRYLYNAYRLTPADDFAAGFNAYAYCAVETGLISVLLLLYFLIRFSLHTLRRWRLFQNPRLRFAITAFLMFLIVFAGLSFFDPRMFGPAIWFVAWSAIGVLVGLVMVRDPVRLFEMALPPPHHRSTLSQPYSGETKSFFSRTPLAKLPSTRSSLLLRFRIGDLFLFLCACAFLFALTVVELAPYAALRIAKLKKNEAPTSPDYLDRLQKAQRLFPASEAVASKMGHYYRQQAKDNLELAQYKDQIEAAYLKAVSLNHYDPSNYEMLYYLYRDTSNYQSALSILAEGVQNNPNELVLRMLLVIELEKTGNLSLATHHVKQALFRIAPNQTQLFLRLAELYYYRGQADDAIWFYQYARQVVPETPQVQQRMKRLREQLKLPA